MEMGHAARTALSTRLAGPGAHSGLIDEVAVWMDVREKAVLDGGFAVAPRVVANLWPTGPRSTFTSSSISRRRPNESERSATPLALG